MEQNIDAKTNIDIREILAILPHRYPFLLVDRIIELVPSKYAVGLKNVTINEPFFQGHFPASPVMPGVLIIEAMAQVAAILTAKSMKDAQSSSIPYLVGIDDARFRKVVTPGDVLTIRADIVQNKSGIWIIDAKASINSTLIAAQARLMATLKNS